MHKQIYRSGKKSLTLTGPNPTDRHSYYQDGCGLAIEIQNEWTSHTGFVWENGRTDGARPHAQSRGDVGRLWVSGQVFAQAAFVDVMLAANWTSVGWRSAFDAGRSRHGPTASSATSTG